MIRKKQLKDLAPFCLEEKQQKRLQFLASTEGNSEYKRHVQENMLGLLEVLEEFNIEIPLAQLIHIANPIVPRLYTIASSSLKHPDSIHICFSIVKDQLPNGKAKTGLTSSFVLRKNEDYLNGRTMSKIRIGVANSSFLLPSDPKVPVTL